MKTTKIIALFIALCLFALSVFGCADNSAKKAENSNKTEVKIGLLKGPTGMGAAYLWHQSKNSNYKFSLETDASVMGSKLLSGEYNIAAIPTNAAAALYNKTGGKIKVIAVNTLGTLYVLSKGNIKDIKDLKNKTVYTSGQGSAADYVFKYLLNKNNLFDGKNINIKYSTEHSETLAKALSNKADIVMLPEPFVTNLLLKNPKFIISVDLNKEWESTSEGSLCLGALAVNADFANKNKTEINNFLKEYSKSVDFCNNNISKASKIIEECDILPKEVAKKAIPTCKIVCITNKKMQENLESFYNVIFSLNKQSIGGKLPNDDFYFVN